MTRKLVILGSGGHGSSVADAVLSNPEYELVGFIDKGEGETYLDIPIIGDDGDLPKLSRLGIEFGFIGVGYTGGVDFRPKLVSVIEEANMRLATIVDASAHLAQDVTLGRGTFVGKGAVLNACSSLGEGCIVNSGAIVEHGCAIGDYSHIAVGAVLCGDVIVGKRVFVGANATVLPGVRIGDGAVVGAGSIVLGDVPDEAVVYGVHKKGSRCGQRH